MDGGGAGGGGAKSYDGEKAWFSINHSILSGVVVQQIESKTGLLYTYLLRWLFSVDSLFECAIFTEKTRFTVTQT
jgi:hypothetical protein